MSSCHFYFLLFNKLVSDQIEHKNRKFGYLFPKLEEKPIWMMEGTSGGATETDKRAIDVVLTE